MLVVCAGTAALVAIYGTSGIGIDTQYALLWGNQLAHGARIELDAPFATTPHPLTILIGAVVAVIGGTDGAAMAVLQHAALVIMVIAIWMLAAQLFDRWVATLAVVLLAFCPLLVLGSFAGLNTAIWIGGLMFIARAELRSPRCGAPVLWGLGILGLMRPEAWILAGAYCVYLGFDPERRRARYVAAAVVPPLVWMAFELWVTGDPLFSLHHTTEFRAALGRETGLTEAIQALPALVEEALGRSLALAGMLGLVLALASGHPGARRVISWASGLVVLFFALSAKGFSIIPGYLLPLDVLLVIFAAAALFFPLRAAGRQRIALGAAAILVATALIVDAPDRLTQQQVVRAEIHRMGAAWSDLTAVVAQEDARKACGPVDLSGALTWRPLLAMHLRQPVSSLRDATRRTPRFGLLLLPVDPLVRSAATGTPMARRAPSPPGDAKLVRSNRSWAAWAWCSRAMN